MNKPLDLLRTEALGNAALQLMLQGSHILAAQGHASGLAGQLSLRANGQDAQDQLWTLAMGAGLEEAAPDNVILVARDMQVLQGTGQPNPGIRFHQWIYQHHPHVRAIVHTHPPALSSLSMLGIRMPVAHMDAAMFYDDCGYLEHWPGVPTGDEEGQLISAALQGKRSAFLLNHGIVCTGASMQEAIYLNVFAERNARMCLDALAAGGISPIDLAAAQEAHDFLLQPSIVNATFDYWARAAARQISTPHSLR
jgi:L-fuculose-phosphate aldolase